MKTILLLNLLWLVAVLASSPEGMEMYEALKNEVHYCWSFFSHREQLKNVVLALRVVIQFGMEPSSDGSE